MIVSGDKYCRIILDRGCGALKNIKFWRELIATFPLGLMGIWLPYFLGWNLLSLWDPNSLFIFGVVTLFSVLEKRLFLGDDEDSKFSSLTKLVVLVGTIFAVIFYGKAIVSNDVFWGVIALLITCFIWFYNFINKNENDKTDINASLGGNV